MLNLRTTRPPHGAPGFPRTCSRWETERFRSPPPTGRRIGQAPTLRPRVRRVNSGRGVGGPRCGSSTALSASPTCHWPRTAYRPCSTTLPGTGPATPATRCSAPRQRWTEGWRLRVRARRCAPRCPCRWCSLTRAIVHGVAGRGRGQERLLRAVGAAKTARAGGGATDSPLPAPTRHVAGRAAAGRAWLPHHEGAPAGGPARGADAGPERPRPSVRSPSPLNSQCQASPRLTPSCAAPSLLGAASTPRACAPAGAPTPPPEAFCTTFAARLRPLATGPSLPAAGCRSPASRPSAQKRHGQPAGPSSRAVAPRGEDAAWCAAPLPKPGARPTEGRSRLWQQGSETHWGRGPWRWRTSRPTCPTPPAARERPPFAC